MPWSRGGLVVAMVLAAVLLAGVIPLDTNDRANAVSAIGTLATLLSLGIAIAIFRWTQRQGDDARRHVDRRFKDMAKLMSSALVAFEAGEDVAPDLTTVEPVAEPESAGGVVFKLNGNEYRIAPIGDQTARWWSDLLRRVREVADADNDFSVAARQLLDLPFRNFRYTAGLAKRQRGNRPTIVFTEDDDGTERVWSVFTGKGGHVKEVTPDQ